MTKPILQPTDDIAGFILDGLHDYRSPPFERAGTRKVGPLIPDADKLARENPEMLWQEVTIVGSGEPDSELVIHVKNPPHETRQFVGIPVGRLQRARRALDRFRIAAEFVEDGKPSLPGWARKEIEELQAILGKPS